MTDQAKRLRAWCNSYECVAARSEEEARELVRALGTYEDEDLDGEGWTTLRDEAVLREEDGTPTDETIADLLRGSDEPRRLYSCVV